MASPDLADLLDRARAWLAEDPDPATRATLEDEITAAAEGGDATVLADRFDGTLEFGTAGLRGALGPGPNRMNRLVVQRAAAGLASYLREHAQAGRGRLTVVIGYDARHNSEVFARDTAAVMTGAGIEALVLPRALPTPVVAFAVLQLGCAAGVMVTASHNPPEDNGYKVYLGDGSQIVPPADRAIAEQIAAVPSVAQVPRADDSWVTLDDSVVEAYLDAAVAVLDPDGPRALSVVHTALHGVGSDVVREAFLRAGFPAPAPVAEQQEPDPDFPSVAFPNPEEPGAIDAALALAERERPDLVVANDPDADRCALAVRDGGSWRMLRGDEVGALLGQHVIDRGRATGDRTVLARSIVSSRLLGAMADAAGLPGEETLTGFKWIGRVPGLAYGYEEALGYCVDPATVPDKDGVTAALMAAEMAAGLKAQGRTLLDVLDDLARRHGVHQTDAFSVRVSDLSLIPPVMQRLRDEPPARLGSTEVSSVEDLAEGVDGLPPTEGMRFLLADGTRVIVRPSGTEPKLKVYLEAVVPVDGDDGLPAAREEAARRLAGTRSAMEELTRV